MKQEVKNWLEKAKSDLITAEYNLKGNMLDAAAFYSQQSAEKGLKALYIERFNELWKIHDLVRLAEKIDAPAEIIKLCAKITPAYTITRYPDVVRTYNREDVQQILNAAKEVLNWVKERLSL